jgi:hypothetical protein
MNTNKMEPKWTLLPLKSLKSEEYPVMVIRTASKAAELHDEKYLIASSCRTTIGSTRSCLARAPLAPKPCAMKYVQ